MAVKMALALAVAFLVTVIACRPFIDRIRLLQFGQQIREDGPSSHRAKAGTPTMGGMVILAVATPVGIIFAGSLPSLYPLILVALGCGLIGFWDDYFKVARGRSLGLKARSKLAGGLVITLLFILLLRLLGLYSTQVIIPYLGAEINFGSLYPLLVFLVIIAASNSVNLTDGIDGLAAGAAVIALFAFTWIAYRAGLAGAALYCGALAGSCLGFLVYNRHPARLFMGDVGSLALGGAFAALAVILKVEFFLVIIGGVFVLEALSVIIQVASFQLTGRRVFLMSPLHHHFELKGWSEWRVVLTFWGAALIFALLGLAEYSRLVAA